MQKDHRKTVTLVLGGVRSGKSRYAQQIGEQAERVVFVATAHAGDDEMQRKIDGHRSSRPPHWITVEEPVALAETIARHGPGCDLVIIDCLTFFATNLLLQKTEAEYTPIETLCAALLEPPCSVVLVSNEVGSGVVPPYPLGRQFRDLLGEINQRVAAVASDVLLLVAGLPLVLKGAGLRALLLLCAVFLTLLAPVFASRTVTDETGRKVTLPDHPHRVVCLAPSITDTVFALGSGNDVVAVSDYTNFPPEALKKPSIGSLIKPSIETILSFHPDLVIGINIPGSDEAATQLQALGIPVYLVDPKGLAGILQSVSSVGEALNRTQQADALNASLTSRIAAVRARAVGKPSPKVLLPVWYDPIITIGKHAFITEIIETAGASSVTDDLIPDWPQMSLESLVTRSPDALVLIRGGKITVDMLKNRPGWSTLPAIKAARVYYVDSGIQEPSPEAINALEELAKEFHP